MLVAGLLLAAILPAVAPPAAQAAAPLEAYMTGLDWPIALGFATDGRIFFAERNSGRIRIIENDILLPEPYYTLTATITGGERGLLGLALHPDFPLTPFVYAYHSFDDGASGTRYNRVVRLSGSGNTGSFDRTLVGPIPMNTNHNGGILGFGPDDKLYVTTGDAGPPSNGQDLSTPAGKILRVNDDGTAPQDNPFFGSPTADDRIFTYGHRNVFGLAFHPTTGRVFVTENGPTCNDEVNLLVAGRNFGWGPSQTCGSPPSAPLNTNRDGPSPILPIWHAGPPMVVPTNAAVYDGPLFPQYRGDLIMGDAGMNFLRRLDLAPPSYDAVQGESVILEAPSFILDVEIGPDGAIWLTTSSAIYRYWATTDQPIASFTASPSLATVGVPVRFDATASIDPDGTLVSYEWDFGDGGQGAGRSILHTYPSARTFQVTLTVTDNATLNDTASMSVVVLQPSGAIWWFAVAPVGAACALIAIAIVRRRRRIRE